MLKKLLMLCVALMLSVGAAFAAVDVNTADQAALEAVKGLGPVKSKAIIDERTKNGPYKDADDLATRVKGLGTQIGDESRGGRSDRRRFFCSAERQAGRDRSHDARCAPAKSPVKSSTARRPRHRLPRRPRPRRQ